MSVEHEFQNEMVLEAVQALLGNITPQMRAVAIATDARQKSVDLYFAANGVIDRELLDDIASELTLGTANEVLTRCHAWQGDDWSTNWPEKHRRLIFAMA